MVCRRRLDADSKNPELDSGYEGHEAIMILNCHDRPANVLMDVYFQDREPQTGVPLTVAARRITCLRMDHPAEIGGIQIPVGRSTRFGSRATSMWSSSTAGWMSRRRISPTLA